MRIHFISIGGSVMHQLAIALKLKGYQVTGTDDDIFEPASSNLKKHGLLPEKTGWQPELITPGLDAVILGMHARIDNPELIKARELGLPIYSFPEYIYKESIHKTRVAIGGSHGKTTTTSMVMHVLQFHHKAFDYLVGAALEGFSQSVNITDAPTIVCEADEYPASALERRPKFHFLHPQVAVLTGIAWDHINVFPKFSNYLEQFEIFINKIIPNGILIYNESDETLKSLVESTKRDDIRYQPYSVPVHEINNGVTSLTIEGITSDINVFGHHNLMNILAAYYVCKELGIDARGFMEAIASFKGAAKRLEIVAQNKHTTIFRDFAHAPSKVNATIRAVKEQFPERQLIAALELHTYSSLNRDFLPQYAGSLDVANVACVYYSRHALEIKKMPPLDVETVKAGFNNPDLFVFSKPEDFKTWLDNNDYQNATLLLMSSGTFDGLNYNELDYLLK
ncbi:UDP-N-acetylmuramate--L-alanine ligase [Polluticaenibacter yanchengensis]|uniref:Mur ligase family protein n=1 Tax=Polluticaenibacter yanchengensis TaxID=3014562 RepID=A0ABT4UPQ8_9BACT|nr:Mur ligase family protein [Chitinophagaceae bacterium LY-5]